MEKKTVFGKKRVATCLTIILSILSPATYASIHISGIYQGKNLKMSNPVSEDGFGYAVTKIVVNGNILPLKFQGTTAIIDFKQLALKPGALVLVDIDYQNKQCPVIYSSNVLDQMTIIYNEKDSVGQIDSPSKNKLLDSTLYDLAEMTEKGCCLKPE